jgi:hypothetical protein
MILNLNSNKTILDLKNKMTDYIYKYNSIEPKSVWTYFISDKITDVKNIKYNIRHKIIKSNKPIDLITYKNYIDNNNKSKFTTFLSLNKKTILIIPIKPFINITDYVLNSLNNDWTSLWKYVKIIAQHVIDKYGYVYISTHGHGVNYLHIRLELKLPYPELF